MKTASNNPENAIMKMARKTGVVRAREIRKAGLHPEYLRKLCKSGLLIRTGRGLYVLADGDFYRQTRDIDLLAFKSETIDSLKAVFQEISQISFADDGLAYLSDTVNVNEIREEKQYGGYRVTLRKAAVLLSETHSA
jgi:hypothetical protein